MKQKKKEQLISIPSLCDLYGKDPSQMRKMIKKLDIKTVSVRRASDNRPVTAIYDSDHQLLVDNYNNLTTDKATKAYISVAEACEKLGYKNDAMSNFTRACATYNIEIFEKRFNNRTQKCVKRKDFQKFKKLRNALAVVDV